MYFTDLFFLTANVLIGLSYVKLCFILFSDVNISQTKQKTSANKVVIKVDNNDRIKKISEHFGRINFSDKLKIGQITSIATKTLNELLFRWHLLIRESVDRKLS